MLPSGLYPIRGLLYFIYHPTLCKSCIDLVVRLVDLPCSSCSSLVHNLPHSLSGSVSCVWRRILGPVRCVSSFASRSHNSSLRPVRAVYPCSQKQAVWHSVEATRHQSLKSFDYQREKQSAHKQCWESALGAKARPEMGFHVDSLQICCIHIPTALSNRVIF